MKKKVVWLIIIIIVFSAVFLIKKRIQEIKSSPYPVTKIISVRIVKPKLRTVEQVQNFLGKYYSINHPFISSKVSGLIEDVFVQEGEVVRKGNPIVKIEDKELRKSIASYKFSVQALKKSLDSLKVNLKSLKSDYLYAKSIYNRNIELYNAGALSKEKFSYSKVIMELKLAKLNSMKEAIEAKQEELKAVIANLNAKKSLLQYTNIVAPIDGVITKIFLRRGDFVNPAKPILQMVGLRKRIEFYFPPKKQSLITVGSIAYIKNKKFKITKITPLAFKNLVVGYIDFKDFKGNLFLSENTNILVKVVLKKSRGMSVPLSAIYESADGRKYIFVYRKKRFFPIAVEILAQDDQFAVVSKKIQNPVAIGSNDKLAKLFVARDIQVVENE
ncbi:Barrel-sandwich domain of CusB or HlyD membrane-fusion [Desulfonauticus submarinus]|uniref:Barrel-sandwich domain of CusB or HlyD membrane-fusion n=1 Tax=Desulfonauticus submarinus TaxID=206665 RepID=A0A1H0BMP1_9BACT|nr:biotin/lipoyl-binding protein [Desulfonauticus submarinus]SDN46733.1 Barrel-sandwich domain of CusB or HlyD membrane-fusion [Desulfonauticus submarinus]